LLGGAPEIVHGVLLVGQNGAVRDENAVGADALAGVGEMERVVEREGCGIVLEGVEVPVGLLMVSRAV